MCELYSPANESQEGVSGEIPCLFVSYQRPDKVIVEDILRRLKRNGLSEVAALSSVRIASGHPPVFLTVSIKVRRISTLLNRRIAITD